METTPEDDDDDDAAAAPAGRYANYFAVGYNAVEFLLDCGQCYGDSASARVHTRIVTSPIYAQALFAALGKSLSEYERAFGSIPEQ